MSRIADNLARIRESVETAARRAGRDPESVRICTVTKSAGAVQVREAVNAGARLLGENRIQKVEGKIEALADLEALVEWRMIGHLQGNKARRAVELFAAIESVHSIGLARRLDALGQERGTPVRVLLEVKTSDEETKGGLSLDEAPEAIAEALGLPGLRVEGLMTMAPFTDDEKRVRGSFASLREVREKAGGASRLPELSMGMTADYPIAIEEGATIVRLGTAIFG